MIEGYEATEVDVQLDVCCGEVDRAFDQTVSNQTLFELLGMIFPKIKDRVDVISEIRITVKVREK